MSIVSIKLPNQNRTAVSVPEILSYRSYLKWMHYAFASTGALCSVLVIGATALLYFDNKPDQAEIIFTIGAAPAGVFILSSWFLRRNYVAASVQVFSDRVVINRNGTVIEYLFADITAVHVSSIPILSSFAICAKNRHTFHFSETTLKGAKIILDAMRVFNPKLIK